MAKSSILIVEDDKKICDLLVAYLKKDGYSVFTCHNGIEGLETARQKKPDILILDLMLPGMDGLDICRVLRAEGNKIPILMLTARTTENDKLVGLELGADDYVTKPFSPRELVARVRAVLRRARSVEQSELPRVEMGDLEVDFKRHSVRVCGRPVQLTPKEFKILEVMINEPGRVFSRLDLLDLVFGFDYEGLERTVDVHIMNLRKKIEPDPKTPRYIQTVYGIGYKLQEQSNVH